jgi:hypothetical protein
MTAVQKEVLFYVFTGFFVLIGVGSLLVLSGLIKNADRTFRKWALGGFVVAVTGAVVGLFKLSFLSPLALITVTLVPPGEPPTSVVLDKPGAFRYDVIASEVTGQVATKRGPLVAVQGDGNAWQVRLPGDVVDKAVRLEFEDSGGNLWVAGPFYPNVIQQRMRPGQKTSSDSRDSPMSIAVAVVLAAENRPDSTAQQQAIVKFNNNARPIGNQSGRPYYQWRLFVDEKPEVLDTIQQVDYVLHPTFPDPFRSSRDREHQFELVASGWGTFRIVITIHFTNGTEAKTSYMLDFQKGWPVPSSPQDLDRRSPAETDLFAGRWRLNRARSKMGIYDEVVEEVLDVRIPGASQSISSRRKLSNGKSQQGSTQVPCDGAEHESSGHVMACRVVASDEVQSYVKTPGHKPPVLYSVRKVEGDVMTLRTYSDEAHQLLISTLVYDRVPL